MTVQIRINPYGSRPPWSDKAEAAAFAAVENCARAWLARAEQVQVLLAELSGGNTFAFDDAVSHTASWIAERDLGGAPEPTDAPGA